MCIRESFCCTADWHDIVNQLYFYLKRHKGTDSIYSYLQCMRQPTPWLVLKKICLLPCIKRLTIIKFAFLWLLMKKVSLKNPLRNVHVLLMIVLDLGFLPCTPPAILLLFSLPTHQGCQHSQNPSCLPYALWLSFLSFSHPEGFIQVLWGCRALHPPLP